MQSRISVTTPRIKNKTDMVSGRMPVAIDELILLRECAAKAAAASAVISHEDAEHILSCCEKIRLEKMDDYVSLSCSESFNCGYLVSLVDERLLALLETVGSNGGAAAFVDQFNKLSPAGGHYLMAAACRIAVQCSWLEKRLLDLERIYLRRALNAGGTALFTGLSGELDAAACGRIINEVNKMLLTVNIRHCPVIHNSGADIGSTLFWETFNQQLSLRLPARFSFNLPGSVDAGTRVLRQLSMLSAVLVNMTVEFLNVGQFLKKSPDSQQILALAARGSDLAETAFFKSNKHWQDSVYLLKALSLQLHMNNHALNSCLRELNANADIRNGFIVCNILQSFGLVGEMLDQLTGSITT